VEGINKGKEAMTHRTIKTLTKVADLLEGFARGIINGLELVVHDAAGAKRSRKARAPRAPRVQRSVYRQAPQQLIIKIVQEKEL
jgi:hypothetical protein